MRLLAALLSLGLSACATTSAGLYESDVEETFTSTRAPSTVATCAADRMRGDTDVRNDGGHYWVVRKNTYGVPTARWDFYPAESGGTRIELRQSIGINAGVGDVRACL